MKLLLTILFLFCTLTSGVLPTNNLSQGLVLYMPLDEAGGMRAFDLTKKNIIHSFNLEAGTTWQPNKHLLFGGISTSKIILTKSSALNLETSPCTVSFWQNRATSGNRYLFCDLNAAANMYGSLISFGMTSGNNWLGWNNVTLITGTRTEVYSQWRHVVGIRSGVTGAWNASLYVDGVLENTVSTALNPQPQATNGTPGIGTPGDYTGGTFRWNGYMRDVMVWNRALTAEEVRQLYVMQHPSNKL